MANLYYREDLPDDAFAVGEVVEIVGDEARHAVRVSRLRVGEQTMVGNGAGALGVGETVLADRDRFAVRLAEVRREPEPECELVLVQALAKGDRDERAIEQATEFGIDRIVPWQAERSVSRWSGSVDAEKAAKGVAKWTRIAREASKQSLRSRVPRVDVPVSLEALREQAARPDAEVILLDPAGGTALTAWTRSFESRGARSISLVIGPEGGHSAGEVAALEAAGAHVLRLGRTVLRTSSAGPAAIAVLNAALSRW